MREQPNHRSTETEAEQSEKPSEKKNREQFLEGEFGLVVHCGRSLPSTDCEATTLPPQPASEQAEMKVMMTEDQIAFVAKQRALFDEIVRTTWRQWGNFNIEDVHASDMELLHNSGKHQFISLISDRVNLAKSKATAA